MMVRKIIILLFVSILVFAVTAYAKTPDGMTPAEETVCDGEVGAAYGLCNAYCEALDCDSDETVANEKACQKLSDRFIEITGRNLPCECFDANDYAGYVPPATDEFIEDCNDRALCPQAHFCESAAINSAKCYFCLVNGTNCSECNDLVLRGWGCENICE